MFYDAWSINNIQTSILFCINMEIQTASLVLKEEIICLI